jgi:hypothetical protein
MNLYLFLNSKSSKLIIFYNLTIRCNFVPCETGANRLYKALWSVVVDTKLHVWYHGEMIQREYLIVPFFFFH